LDASFPPFEYIPIRGDHKAMGKETQENACDGREIR
jgi:hypothetical protein